MKIIFFSFKHRYRIKELNNFLATKKYKDIITINLSGPILHFLAKILIFIKVGKGISCDGRPTIKNKNYGINFWMRGSYLDIPAKFNNYDNNYVPIQNSIITDTQNKIFQIYPLNITKSTSKSNVRIIYVSRTINDNDSKYYNLWLKHKDKIIIDNFTLDKANFWIYIFHDNSIKENYIIYRSFKLYLRQEIIVNLKKRYNEKLILIGDDWKKYYNESYNSIYNIKKLKKIYEGNICLDLGSMLGSVCLYSRSNQIIEAGGLIIQSKQLDSKKVWENLNDDIVFKNQIELYEIMDRLLLNHNLRNMMIKNIKKKFDYGNEKMEESIKKALF